MSSNFWSKIEQIGCIEKNKKEKIVVSRCERNDKKYLDVRIHSKNKYDGDEYLHTPRGITLEVDKIDKLVDLIKQV